MQTFKDETSEIDRISCEVVDADGTIHQRLFCAQTDVTVVLVASTSRVPTIMTMIALREDTNIESSISGPASTYLPNVGLGADRTFGQKVRDPSIIARVRLLGDYGSITGTSIEEFNHLCHHSVQAILEFEACGRSLAQNELPINAGAREFWVRRQTVADNTCNTKFSCKPRLKSVGR